MRTGFDAGDEASLELEAIVRWEKGKEGGARFGVEPGGWRWKERDRSLSPTLAKLQVRRR